jgi:uncharacterized membrane protein
MELLILGLVLFVGGHSVNLFANQWRNSMVEKVGLLPWKGLYSLFAIVGLVCLVYGYGDARAEGVYLWQPPVWTRHIAALLTLPAFLLLFASQIPGNRLQVATGHPMYLGIKLWAFAHIIANGGLHDVLLFGTFLIWGIAGFAVSRRRDKAAGTVREYKGLMRDGITLVVSLGAWAGFAFWAHAVLIGVPPFGA